MKQTKTKKIKAKCFEIKCSLVYWPSYSFTLICNADQERSKVMKLYRCSRCGNSKCDKSAVKIVHVKMFSDAFVYL